jgi:hypothetical protein
MAEMYERNGGRDVPSEGSIWHLHADEYPDLAAKSPRHLPTVILTNFERLRMRRRLAFRVAMYRDGVVMSRPVGYYLHSTMGLSM